MTVFAHAAAVIFGDTNISVAATYQPVGGYPEPLRVVRQAPVMDMGFGTSRVSSESVTFQVRRADVPTAQSGDIIICEGQTRIVQGEPDLDAERLVWTLDTRPG
jgi:hypothetical protein